MPDKIVPTLIETTAFEMLEYSKLNRRDSVKINSTYTFQYNITIQSTNSLYLTQQK